MIKRPDTNAQRIKRHKRVRAKISGTPERPLWTKRSKATAATRLLPAPLASWSLSAPRPRASTWSCSTAAVTCTMVVLLSWPKAPVRAVWNSKKEEQRNAQI